MTITYSKVVALWCVWSGDEEHSLLKIAFPCLIKLQKCHEGIKYADGSNSEYKKYSWEDEDKRLRFTKTLLLPILYRVEQWGAGLWRGKIPAGASREVRMRRTCGSQLRLCLPAKLAYLPVQYSSLTSGGYLPKLPWRLETIDSTKPYIYYTFFSVHSCLW